jgi:hypothetical protein
MVKPATTSDTTKFSVITLHARMQDIGTGHLVRTRFGQSMVSGPSPSKVHDKIKAFAPFLGMALMTTNERPFRVFRDRMVISPFAVTYYTIEGSIKVAAQAFVRGPGRRTTTYAALVLLHR